jgi:hypothetical protein
MKSFMITLEENFESIPNFVQLFTV